MRRLSLALCFTLFTVAAHADSIPDAGSLMRETEKQQPRCLPQPAPLAIPEAPLAKDMGAVQVKVKGFRLTGASLIPEAELQAVLTPWVGREVSFTELQQAVNAITEEYRRRGWFARPQLPAQDVSDGIITINIIEGKLGEVRIDDGGKKLRIEREVITGTMTARQKPGDSLNLEYLDRSTNILNDTPGVAVATILAPGQKAGESDAIVRVQDKAMLAGTVQIDNQGARSTGENKLSVNGMFDNPLGIGDQVSINGNTSDGSDYLKFGYSLPVGRDGLRVGASTSAMRYKLIGELASLNAKGEAQTFGVNGSYPLLRSGTRNIALTIALDRKNYYNEANQIATSEKQLDTALFALNGDLLDGLSSGGMTLWGISLAAGDVDLSANATNQTADSSGPRTAGSYQKLGWNLARLQRFSDKTTLWTSINGQFAGKNLDSAEKFSLGGPSGVRAYPLIEGSGDDGWLATLEVRHKLLDELQISAFYDQGTIRQSHNTDYTGTPTINDATLKGVGIGVNWSQPGNFALYAILARRIGDNPLRNLLTGNDSDGSLDRDRLWLSAVKFF